MKTQSGEKPSSTILVAHTILLFLVSNIRHRVNKINTFAERVFPYFGRSVVTQLESSQGDVSLRKEHHSSKPTGSMQWYWQWNPDSAHHPLDTW